MKKALAAWIWSLSAVGRSYRTVVVFAAVLALWVFGAYEWLGLPESSGLLLMLGLVWAIAQLLIAVVVVAGLATSAAAAAADECGSLPPRSLWAVNGKRLLHAVGFCVLAIILVGICSAVFGWVHEHSIEVASYLTFHSQKAVSHVPIEEIYNVIEWLLWAVIAAFLLSFMMVLMREGWGGAVKQAGKLLAACAVRTPFLTTLLGAAVFGGIAYKLANWHPVVPPGFWDYSQMIVRFSLVLILVSAGALFWPLALARLILPNQAASESPK